MDILSRHGTDWLGATASAAEKQLQPFGRSPTGSSLRRGDNARVVGKRCAYYERMPRKKFEVLVHVQPEILPRVTEVLGRFEVRCAITSSLEEALGRLVERPKLVITALDRAGLELCRTVGTYCRGTKVVVLEV
jgi:hypothetical protein